MDKTKIIKIKNKVIMKPTLEEVKEYFKDAETVKCISENRIEDIAKEIIEDVNYDLGAYWIRTEKSAKGKGDVLLWSEDKGYAKILTYKQKKFEITKEQIWDIDNFGYGKMREWFPEAFKKELIVGKWYKNKYDGLFCITEKDNEKYRAYGFMQGNWKGYGEFTNEHDLSSDTEATPKEVKTALINECEKIGLTDGVYYLSPNRGYKRVLKYPLKLDKGILVDDNYNYVFDSGIFAKPIETITIQEAEKLLNKKIVGL